MLLTMKMNSLAKQFGNQKTDSVCERSLTAIFVVVGGGGAAAAAEMEYVGHNELLVTLDCDGERDDGPKHTTQRGDKGPCHLLHLYVIL